MNINRHERDRALYAAFRRELQNGRPGDTMADAVRRAMRGRAPSYYVDFATAMHRLPTLRRMPAERLSRLCGGRWASILRAVESERRRTSLGMGDCVSRVLAGPAPEFFVSYYTAWRIVRRMLAGRGA